MQTLLTEKQQFWLSHVRVCDASGQSMRAYADANGLKAAEFYSWKTMLRRKGVLDDGKPAAGNLFRKAEIVDGRFLGHCRVTLSCGIALDIEVGTEPAWVAQLASALSGR